MIVVTGASGFVGSALARRLAAEGRAVRALARREGALRGAAGLQRLNVGDLTTVGNWREVLGGARALVHCAARVHVMQDRAADPLAAFRRMNVELTHSLARAAADAGVRRFVFVSSIKVNGEATLPGRPFAAADAPAPVDPYGISKWEAEKSLWQVAADTGLEVVVIRPPLVYGPGVRANFQSMMRWVRAGVPLPLGAIDNRRSLVALDNLVDLVVATLDRPEAAGGTFLASDGEDLSTTDLLRRLGTALHRPARLVPVPAAVLRTFAGLVGRRDVIDRLCGSLQVDLGPTRARLGWTPPLGVDEALARAAAPLLLSQTTP